MHNSNYLKPVCSARDGWVDKDLRSSAWDVDLFGCGWFVLCRALKGRKKAKEKKQREPRIAFLTKSDVDHLEDGYRWRKYGQKAVKNSPFPRYIRASLPTCSSISKRRVQWSIRTYPREGLHWHISRALSKSSADGFSQVQKTYLLHWNTLVWQRYIIIAIIYGYLIYVGATTVAPMPPAMWRREWSVPTPTQRSSWRPTRASTPTQALSSFPATRASSDLTGNIPPSLAEVWPTYRWSWMHSKEAAITVVVRTTAQPVTVTCLLWWAPAKACWVRQVQLFWGTDASVLQDRSPWPGFQSEMRASSKMLSRLVSRRKSSDQSGLPLSLSFYSIEILCCAWPPRPALSAQ